MKKNWAQQRIKNIGQTRVSEGLVLSTNFTARLTMTSSKSPTFFIRETLCLIVGQPKLNKIS